MKSPMPFSLPRLMGIAMAGVMLASATAPAVAQSGSDDARMRKIEAEIRALQRKVFPGGDQRYFKPEIDTANPAKPSSALPSSSAVTDILARLDALEAQLQRLTARSEENANAIALLQTRVGALENPAAQTAPQPETTPKENATQANLGAMTGGGAQSGGKSADTAKGPSPQRLAAVQEIAKPQSDDPADDEYSYGYRLWKAGFYPEAEQQLTMFVEKYPSHWRTTYGRNLLGRAYLDDGEPRKAAPWFLRNYQADKQAARAGDSLLYLAEAMIALEDTNRACIALAEFGETYPALATGRLKAQYEANRKKVTCN